MVEAMVCLCGAIVLSGIIVVCGNPPQNTKEEIIYRINNKKSPIRYDATEDYRYL